MAATESYIPNGENSPDTSLPPMWTLDEIEEEVMAIAKSYQRPMLKKIFDRLRKKLGLEHE
jgi:hypothetical protein